MSAFSYESQGTNTYLVYQVQEDDVIDSMSLGMLSNNKISGIAQTQFLQIDAARFLKYNVSSKVSLRQFFSGSVNKKRLIGAFGSIIDGCLAAEDYMIDISSLLFDMDHMYVDVSSNEVFLICLPVCNTEKVPTDLGGFFKNIMFTTQFDQSENCDHVARIINFLNGSPVFSLHDFKALLSEIKTAPVAAQAPRSTAVQPTKTAVPVQTQEVPPQAAAPVAAKPISIPKAEPAPAPAPAAEPTPVAPPEKKISMMHLLMHYSKENAAAYKAQKEAQKSAASVAAPVKPGKKEKKEKEKKNQPVASFAIPGQAAQPVSQPVVQPTPQAAPQPKVQAAPQSASPAPTPSTPPVYVPAQTPQGQGRNFGETVCLGGGASLGTTVLCEASSPEQTVKPYLIRAKNNEKIMLNKSNFRVGKESSFVDYFIGDNPAVSRSHACFITREGEFFVMDTNSTNHTYVNGERLQSNTEFQISHGDKIRLGNEEFEFKLY
ncbi:MAG: FHA domain-containing protein [Ruminococcaceae bacterium]|nr:FHA domain-containing protein [Oscillospiraceae bacterium]